MKIKYFLRGFGTGILFATIILSISFALRSTPSNSGDAKASEKKEIPSQTETEKETRQDAASPSETTISQETTSHQTLTIEKGMTSTSVARNLESLGVIENAEDFDKYLNDNGYSRKIVVGSYEVSQGSTYRQIADKITR